jgi:hypothetical protein
MMLRSIAFASLLLSGSLYGAYGQEQSRGLPIDIPKEAPINFEAEGQGKQFLGNIKHLLSGNTFDPTAPTQEFLTIKTPLGDINLKFDDLEPILEKFHQLHVVCYTLQPKEEPFSHFEKQFAEDGMQKVASAPGANGVLIMRHRGKYDCYGVVARQKDSVIVLRTEGAPGLGDLGKVIFESLAHTIQDSVAKHKKH